MRKAIPALCQLLQSKTSTDVLETIDFFISAYEFGLSHSEEGIRRMANLVWSRDAVVKKAVVSAFERLYINVSCENPRYRKVSCVWLCFTFGGSYIMIKMFELLDVGCVDTLIYEILSINYRLHGHNQLYNQFSFISLRHNLHGKFQNADYWEMSVYILLLETNLT